MGESCIRVKFVDVRNLVVPVFLCTSFMGEIIKDTIPGEIKISSFNSLPMSVLILHETETYIAEVKQDNNIANMIA